MYWKRSKSEKRIWINLLCGSCSGSMHYSCSVSCHFFVFVNYTVWFHAVDWSCVYDAEQRHYSQYVNYYAPAQGALSDDAVWRLSRTSGRQAACLAGRLNGAYRLIGPGSAGLAQGCRCALPLQAWARGISWRPPACSLLMQRLNSTLTWLPVTVWAYLKYRVLSCGQQQIAETRESLSQG